MNNPMWNVVKVTWNSDERRGSVHSIWREEVVTTVPTIGEARDVTAQFNVPGNGHYWEIRPAVAGARSVRQGGA